MVSLFLFLVLINIISYGTVVDYNCNTDIKPQSTHTHFSNIDISYNCPVTLGYYKYG